MTRRLEGRGAYDTELQDSRVKASAGAKSWGRGFTGCGELAVEIRKARREKRLTQAELAKVAGLTRSALAQIETARMAVTVPTWARLQAALGLQRVEVQETWPAHHNERIVRLKPGPSSA